MGRSPSLLSASHLTEQEQVGSPNWSSLYRLSSVSQLELVARAYRSSECDTESTTGEWNATGVVESAYYVYVCSKEAAALTLRKMGDRRKMRTLGEKGRMRKIPSLCPSKSLL